MGNLPSHARTSLACPFAFHAEQKQISSKVYFSYWFCLFKYRNIICLGTEMTTIYFLRKFCTIDFGHILPQPHLLPKPHYLCTQNLNFMFCFVFEVVLVRVSIVGNRHHDHLIKENI